MFAYHNNQNKTGFFQPYLMVSAFFICLLSALGVFATPASLAAENKGDPTKEIVSITQKETQVISELDMLNRALNDARKKKSMLQKDIRSLDKRISKNQQRSKQLSEQIKENEAYAHARIVALYKLHQRGRLNVLASADTLYDVFQRKQALETILQQDNRILTNLLTNQTELGQIRQKLLDQKAEKDALEKKLNVQLANTARQPYVGSAARVFSDLKGLLIMPVKGKIVAFFGPYTNARFQIVNFRSGINIRAERGEPIQAVYKGKTLYADWFKGYGNMIIIDHGDHYYTLYAHAEELFKKKGDFVEAGEVIATVGDTGSMDDPGLHFEVRHHGQPIDPIPWISQG